MRLQCTGGHGTVQSLLPDAPSESYDSDCSSSFSFSFTSFCRAVAFHFLFCTNSEMNFGISLPSRAQSTCLPLNLNDQRALSFLPGRTPSFTFPFPSTLPFAFALLVLCCANCTLTPNSSERFQQCRANLQREIT